MIQKGLIEKERERREERVSRKREKKRGWDRKRENQ